MYTIRKHFLDQITIAEKVTNDFSHLHIVHFIDFCFEGKRGKKIIKREVEIPANLKTGYNESKMDIPRGIFHPNNILEVDHLSIKSTFTVNHSVNINKSLQLKGEISSRNKKGILSKIIIKRGEASEGTNRLLVHLARNIT